MNFVGALLRLPCGCTSARPPGIPGTFEKRCRVCRQRYTLVVEPTAHLSDKLGHEVLRARWQTKDAA